MRVFPKKGGFFMYRKFNPCTSNNKNSFLSCFFTLFLAIFTVFTLFTYVPIFAFGPSSPTIYQGIDVSSWQGNIDFSRVKNAGIDIVYIKSSEGRSYIDPYFEINYFLLLSVIHLFLPTLSNAQSKDNPDWLSD